MVVATSSPAAKTKMESQSITKKLSKIQQLEWNDSVKLTYNSIDTMRHYNNLK